MSDDTPTRPTPRSLLSAVTNDTAAAAVVPVLPDDQLDVVAGRVRDAGASQVQLLIPAGAAVFRSPRSFRALRVLLAGSDVRLSVISGDAATLDAAHQAGVDTLGLDTSARAAHALPPSAPAARPIDDSDAAFLRDLDDVGGEGAGLLEGADADLYASLDDLADVTRDSAAPSGQAPRDDRSSAHELDTLAGIPAAEAAPRAGSRPLPEAAMRRLSGDTSPDLTRPRPRPRPDRPVPHTHSEAALVPVAPPRRPPRALPVDDEYLAVPRRRAVSLNLILLLVIAGLLLAGLLWALANRVTVVIAPPAGAARQIPFEGRIIPLDRGASGEGASAVQAVPVSAAAEYVLTSQVTSETISPVGRAQGTVLFVNMLSQPVPLPEGTEFVGQNDKGEDVRFVIDSAVTVPGATNRGDLSGLDWGRLDISITARSPGSASNVGENAIKQLALPGQPPILTDRGNFVLRNSPITGGTEEPQRVVTEAEVQRVLGEALTNLYNSGLQALQAEASAQGLSVDPSTVAPSIAQLGNPESYDPPIVSPPVGTPVDIANPSFTVTVRTHFNALAAPSDRPVAKQLETVVPLHFSQSASPPCSAAERQGVRDVSWSWNGERLAIDGVVECTPLQSVPPESVATVRAALVGQSREAAQATLDQYRAQGVIGGYQLPDRAEMPPFEILIDVQVAQPAAGS